MGHTGAVSPTKPVLVIQHLEAEAPGAIDTAARRAGLPTEIVRTDLGHRLPTDPEPYAALVVMGGPMSATSDDRFPTRLAELDLLRQARRAGTPILGVCLGAQLLALAAGGTVHRGTGIEVGWAPVDLLPAAATDALFTDLPGALTVLHWHGDTYDPPPGATPLARSARYPQQAFRVGANAWGLQFHVEVDADAVRSFVTQFPDEAALAAGGAPAITDATAGALAALGPHRDRLLARFVQLAVDHATP
jgi:GMP synthase-like glutamine amidotransferase